jgi:hypothetical protein
LACGIKLTVAYGPRHHPYVESDVRGYSQKITQIRYIPGMLLFFLGATFRIRWRFDAICGRFALSARS